MAEYYRIAPQGKRKGKIFSGLIRNGAHHTHELEVFEDGLFSCWELAELPSGLWVDLLDIKHFRRYIESGWVAGYIPNGGMFSTHRLGDCVVQDGKWFDPKTLENRILALLDELNPERQGLRDFENETGLESYQVTIEDGGWFRKDEHGVEQLGETRSLFCIDNGFYTFCYLAVFPDGAIQPVAPGPADANQVYTVEEIRQEFESGRWAVSVPPGERILLPDLGHFEPINARWSSSNDDFCKDLDDTINTLAGHLGRSETCRQLFHTYMDNPTVALRDALREAYEAVPVHKRSAILKDQDIRDIPIRMVIYGDQEIEHWPHYAAAKTQGKELPKTISVPKPRDES